MCTCIFDVNKVYVCAIGIQEHGCIPVQSWNANKNTCRQFTPQNNVRKSVYRLYIPGNPTLPVYIYAVCKFDCMYELFILYCDSINTTKQPNLERKNCSSIKSCFEKTSVDVINNCLRNFRSCSRTVLQEFHQRLEISELTVLCLVRLGWAASHSWRECSEQTKYIHTYIHKILNMP